ncbi:MAG: Hint domain-containing protein, partial [bacterium]
EDSPTNYTDPTGEWILAQNSTAAKQTVAQLKEGGIEAKSYPISGGLRYYIYVPNTPTQQANLKRNHSDNAAWYGNIQKAALSGSWNLIAYPASEGNGLPSLVWTKDTAARHPGIGEGVGALSPEDRPSIDYYNESNQPTRLPATPPTTTTTNLRRVPGQRLKEMAEDKLAVQYGNYYMVTDVSPQGGIDLMLFAPNDRGNETYKLVKVQPNRVPSSVNDLQKFRTQEWAKKLVEGYDWDQKAHRAELLAGTVEFTYSMLPFGAAWQNAAKGDWWEVAFALGGDAALFLPIAGGFAKTCTTARSLRLLGAGAELGVGLGRATQGYFALQEGNKGKALGYFGEATLRLLGVTVQAINRLKLGCFARGTPVLTVAGPRAIEDIGEGDVVLSADENDPDSPVVEKVVLATHRRLSAVIEVWIGGRCLKVTGEHPVYVRGEGWSEAR